jgi:hypothetical protein
MLQRGQSKRRIRLMPTTSPMHDWPDRVEPCQAGGNWVIFFRFQPGRLSTVRRSWIPIGALPLNFSTTVVRSRCDTSGTAKEFKRSFGERRTKTSSAEAGPYDPVVTDDQRIIIYCSAR